MQEHFYYNNMSTYRELTSMVLDELKIISDDSLIQTEHIIFLLDKYRTFLLKQRYSDIKKEIPESNYQTICLDLELKQAFEGDTCSNNYLWSKQEIPNMLTISTPKVSPMDYFSGSITYINRERFKYVGSNRFLQNIIYSTLAPNKHLYLKSSNPQYKYLERVQLTGVFEDSSKASELSCDAKASGKCDILDMDFPIEEGLIPQMIELIVKELSGVVYRPADVVNNATDDLNKVSTK